MKADELGDALSFVNEPRREPISLRPTGPKRPARWLPWLASFLSLGAVLGFLTYQGIIQVPALQKPINADPPRKQLAAGPVIPPDSISVARRSDTPPQVPSRPGPRTFPPPTRPQAPGGPARQRPSQTRVAPPAAEEVSNAFPPKSPKEILEDKGLKLRGDRYVLADREQSAANLYNKEVPKFSELHHIYPVAYEIDNVLNMIKIAQNMRAGISYDNSDLNIAMDSVPRWGGLRENGLNSVQKEMHYQLLNNRQSMADLDRMIGALRAQLDNYPQRNQVMSRVATLSRTCQQSLQEINNEMNAIASEYENLNRDSAIINALATINRTAKTANTIAASEDFRLAMKKLNAEKQFFQSPAPARTGRQGRR